MKVFDDRPVAVIVPAHDERVLTTQIIKGIPEYIDRVIVVDACNSDDTFAAVQPAATPRWLWSASLRTRA